MNWGEVNRILRQNRLSAPRMRLCKEGKIIPENDYMTQHSLRRGQFFSKIIEEDFYHALRQDATLVLDCIDQLHEPLDDFCARLEQFFCTSLQVNAYMSWGETRGFDIHWDDHDVIILQVEGRKNWFVYGETRKYPMYVDLHSKENKAPETHVWNHVIEEGDLLFIPRGHWHHAVALNEPSLHLTFGFSPVTGLQIIDWLKEKWVTSEIVRQDVPFLSPSSDQDRYWEHLKMSLLETLEKTSLENFVASYFSKAEGRQKFSLPEAVVAPNELSEDTRIQWNVPFGLYASRDDASGNLVFQMAEKTYTFASRAYPFFEKVQDKALHTLADLCIELGSVIPPSQIKTLVSELLLRGFLKVIHD